VVSVVLNQLLWAVRGHTNWDEPQVQAGVCSDMRVETKREGEHDDHPKN